MKVKDFSWRALGSQTPHRPTTANLQKLRLLAALSLTEGWVTPREVLVALSMNQGCDHIYVQGLAKAKLIDVDSLGWKDKSIRSIRLNDRGRVLIRKYIEDPVNALIAINDAPL